MSSEGRERGSKEARVKARVKARVGSHPRRGYESGYKMKPEKPISSTDAARRPFFLFNV